MTTVHVKTFNNFLTTKILWSNQDSWTIKKFKHFPNYQESLNWYMIIFVNILKTCFQFDSPICKAIKLSQHLTFQNIFMPLRPLQSFNMADVCSTLGSPTFSKYCVSIHLLKWPPFFLEICWSSINKLNSCSLARFKIISLECLYTINSLCKCCIKMIQSKTFHN